MPRRTLKTCSTPGCPGLWDGQRCTRCNRKPRQYRPERRGEHRAQQKKWYDSVRWRKVKRVFLSRPENVFCRLCLDRDGTRTVAETIDHIVPPKGDPNLFWSESNFQPSCLRCNNRKAAKERT